MSEITVVAVTNIRRQGSNALADVTANGDGGGTATFTFASALQPAQNVNFPPYQQTVTQGGLPDGQVLVGVTITANGKQASAQQMI